MEEAEPTSSVERGRLPRSLYDFWREVLASDDGSLPDRLAQVNHAVDEARRRGAPPAHDTIF